MAAPELTLVGRVRRAHGLHGELVIEPLTDVPDAVFAPGRRVFAGTIDGDPAPDGRTLVVEESRPFKGGGWIVAFDGIADRTEAERWRERYVLARKDELTPVAEHEVYLHDLLGLSVVRAGSLEPVGDVIDVYELPQGIMLDVRRPKGTVLIPFRPEVVTQVDVAGRRLIIDPPEGLIE
ncbi:MAG TPA: ribosome maturation factor RimM [Gemmatimonadaceae bacterium]|nr:ribosome maturation factor RimM [Gemmatimonadaceae bacterium]